MAHNLVSMVDLGHRMVKLLNGGSMSGEQIAAIDD